jgi:hypothetical protein
MGSSAVGRFDRDQQVLNGHEQLLQRIATIAGQGHRFVAAEDIERENLDRNRSDVGEAELVD